MNKRAVLLMSGVAVASWLSWGRTAFAEPAAAVSSATESAPQDATVGELVVTAFKRQSSVQKMPASITAISGDTLAKTGVDDVRDLSKVVPNLNWGEHFGTTLVTLRGVGTNVDSAVVQPTVAMYVDGIYLPRADMATMRAVDLDRVEVLRGPQGTLYGRNATGGAINLISSPPSDVFGAGVTATAGSRSAYGANAYLTGPLAPGLNVRLSGGYDHEDGYVKVLNTGQRLNGVDDVFVRGAVQWRPAPDWKIDLSVRYDRDTYPNAYQELFSPSPVAPPSGQTTVPNRIIANDRFSQHNEILMGTAGITWSPSDHITVKSLTGIIDHHDDIAVDDDSTLTPLEFTPDYRLPSRSISEEVDVLGDYPRFKWILGGFFFHENSEVFLPVVLESAGETVNLGESSRITNYAVFGDLTYSLTDRLRLNLGLRLNYEDGRYFEFGSISPIVPFTAAPFHTISRRALPKVALQYDLASNVNVYAQWSLGFKAGGANLLGGGTTVLPLYLPETISAYEVGLKSQFFERTVTLNAAVFYYDYNHVQITTDIPPATTLVENAKAHDYGVEADLRWNVTRRLTVNVAPTFLNSRFVNFSSFDPVFLHNVDLNGRPLERAPNFTLNAGAQYRIDLRGLWFASLTLQGDMLYSSTSVLRYYDDAPGESQPPYAVGNLSATLADVGEKTRVSVFVKNVSDALYKQQVTNFGLGNMGNYGPPRTIGVSLSRKF